MKTDNSRAIRARLSMRGGIALVLLCPLVSVVWAELPTGMMIKALPTGPGALELPATPSTSSYRIPSKQAYGLVGHTDLVIAASDRISPGHPVDATPVKFAKFQQAVDGPTWCYPFIAVCPVTLRDERKVVRPSPEFTSIHNGQRYKFASAEAQAKFDASRNSTFPPSTEMTPYSPRWGPSAMKAACVTPESLKANSTCSIRNEPPTCSARTPLSSSQKNNPGGPRPRFEPRRPARGPEACIQRRIGV